MIQPTTRPDLDGGAQAPSVVPDDQTKEGSDMKVLLLVPVVLLLAGCGGGGGGGSEEPVEPAVFATPQEVEDIIRQDEMSGPMGRVWGNGQHGTLTISCVSEDSEGRRFSCLAEAEIAYGGQPTGQVLPLADYDVVCDGRQCQWQKWSR